MRGWFTGRARCGLRGVRGVQLGLGPFTDMTLEEFNTKARAGGVSQSLADARSVGNEMRLPHARDVSSLPEEVDWYAQGAVTEPRDQGACGSCWAFAAVSTIESVNQIFTGDLLDLSEQELVDCDGSNYGCDGVPPAAHLSCEISQCCAFIGLFHSADTLQVPLRWPSALHLAKQRSKFSFKTSLFLWSCGHLVCWCAGQWPRPEPTTCPAPG